MAFLKFLDPQIDHTQILRISAADFNGKDFDGSPFSYVDQPLNGHPPAWLTAAVYNETLVIDARGCDYAWFGVKSKEYMGQIDWAGPGDCLVNFGTDEKPDIVVMPAALVKRFFG